MIISTYRPTSDRVIAEVEAAIRSAMHSNAFPLLDRGRLEELLKGTVQSVFSTYHPPEYRNTDVLLVAIGTLCGALHVSLGAPAVIRLREQLDTLLSG
jgi:UDP-glucose 6-dehydrogenase